jgi:hypothetical protein
MQQAGIAPGKADHLANLISTQHVQDALQQAGNAQAKMAATIGPSFISALNEILLVASLVAFTGAVLALVLVTSAGFAHGTEQEAAPAAA